MPTGGSLSVRYWFVKVLSLSAYIYFVKINCKMTQMLYLSICPGLLLWLGLVVRYLH